MKSITLKITIIIVSSRVFAWLMIYLFYGTNFLLYPYPWLLIPITIFVATICYINVVIPLVKIARAMDNFADGAFEERINIRRVDEVGRIAINFNKLADRVQGLIQTERRMGANLAHELRLPLSRMALLSDLILKCPEESGNVELLKREIIGLSGLSTSLLRLAQYERTEFAIQAEVFSLEELIEEVVSLFQIVATSKNCSFDIEVANGLTLFTDKSLLQIAISNLIDNSIHYTQPDTSIVIKAFVDQPFNMLRIRVTDHGNGVPSEFLERVLLPFERVDYSRNKVTGGAGLGLSIVKSIVKCLGGTIHLQNQNPGLQVELQLPDSIVELP